MVKPGAFIIFHDIVERKLLQDVHIDILSKRLKRDYAFVEIVSDPEQGWAGIGVLKGPVCQRAACLKSNR